MSNDQEEFTERGKAAVVWHMLNSDWGALCGCTQAADSENHKHSLTNRTTRINCPNCRTIMGASNA